MTKVPFDCQIETLQSGVVVVRVEGEATLEDVRGATATLLAEYRSWERPRTLVVDLSELEPVGAKIRQEFAAWRRRHRPVFKTSVYAGVFVVPTALLRGVLTAVSWVQPTNVTRTSYVATIEEAIQRAEAHERARESEL
ncbi:MAG: hypothetical protein AAF411_20865 [Myxococcota bacterium]